MILTDYIALLALAVCLVLWWSRGLRQRGQWLSVMAMLTIVVAAWSLLDDRWQAVLVAVPAVLMLFGLLLGRKRRRQGIPWISGTLLTLLAGLAFLGIWFFPITDLPAPSGSHAVGVRDFELEDSSRLGLIAAGQHEPRRLLVRVWYPADKPAGQRPRPYFSAAETSSTAESIGRFLNAPFAFKHLKHVKTNSYEGAPLAKGLGELPVVMYSHGYSSFAGQNTALMEELASHGYAVFSVQHTYDSGPTVFPNGDILESDPKLLEEMRALAEPSESMKQGFVGETFSARREGQLQARREAMAANQRIVARSAPIWTEDRVFVLNQLQQGAVPESVAEVVAAGKYSHTGQIGMSFGGSTTGEFCYLDSRCAAGVNLDGADYHFTPFGQNEPVPFLMFYSDFQLIARMITGDPDARGQGFNDFSYERPETAGLRPDVVRLKVNSVTHLGVSDFSLFVRRPLRNPLFGSIDSDAMIRIQNDFVRGFFDKYVRNLDNAFPAEQFAAHHAWVEHQDLAALRQDWLKSHPQDETVQVVMETGMGEIVLALYPGRAPKAVAAFLAHVDAGDYDGSFLQRSAAAYEEAGFNLHVVGAAASTDPEAGQVITQETTGELPASVFETSEQSGIADEAGVVALLSPAAGSSFLELGIHVNPTQANGSGPDALIPASHGLATMGRVLTGLPLLRHIQAWPADPSPAPGIQASPAANAPVTIRRIYRQE